MDNLYWLPYSVIALLRLWLFLTTLWIPVVDIQLQLGWGYYVLAFLIIVGATNAVNLTDGLDGLAGGTSAVAAIAFSVIGLMAASMTNSIGAESVAYFRAL